MWTILHFTAEKLTHLIIKLCPDMLGRFYIINEICIMLPFKRRKILNSKMYLVPGVFNMVLWTWPLLCLFILVPIFDESFRHSLAQISFSWGTFPIHPDVLEFPSNWRHDATSPWLNSILNSVGSFAHEVPSQWMETQERKSESPHLTAYFGKITLIV